MSGITENLYLVDEIEAYSGLRIDDQRPPITSRGLSAKITRNDLPASLGTSYIHFDSTVKEGEWVKDESLGVMYKRSVSV